MNTHRRNAFTLVELLVVITIILILVALLAPAMDKAIYQAELVRCAGGQEKNLAWAAMNYATDHRRFYPNARPDGSDGGPIWRQNSMILQVGGEANTYDPRAGYNWDLRRYYYPNYISTYKMFVDPVTDAIDVSPEANDPDCQIFSDYHLNAGWGPAGQGHMRRLGRGFKWTERGVEREIHVLVADKIESEPLTLRHRGSSHPDDAGTLTFGFRQNAESPNQSAQDRALDLWPKKTISGYGSADTRGGIAVNYAFDDGSVRKYDNVAIVDDRMFYVAHENAIPGTGTLPTSAGDPRRTGYPAGN